MSVVGLTVPLELADGGAAYSGSISGVGDVIVVKTSGYNSISIQLTGTWVATVDFSVSNDGINWVKIASESANGLYSYATTGLYFKVSVSAYTSGTINALAYLRFQPVVDVLQADAGSVPQTATASGNGNFLNLDTLGYNSISVQLSGFWTAEAQFQVSNDNTNWVPVQGFGGNSGMTATDTAVDNDIYVFPVVGRYFRLSVFNYQSGPINVTAYLRTQSLAGLGEASLTQAMDQSGMTPLNVTFPGVTGAGQQNAANSVPVALANEQVNDKVIFGKIWAAGGAIITNANLLLPQDQVNNDPGAGIDCIGYRTAYLQTVGSIVSTILFEASNDQVNWLNIPAYNLTTSSLAETYSATYGGSIIYAVPLTARYLRMRSSSANPTVSNPVQVITTLRMTAEGHVARNVVSLQQITGNQLPGGATSPTNYVSYSLVSPALPIGGSDRNYVRSEIIGAPIPTWGSYVSVNGAFRQMSVNLAGGVAVSGVSPNLSEDKVEPVNVRLERTTAGQDSVQDLLKQLLVEIKALSYYTREMPMATAAALATATPSTYASMQDDPENIYDDPSSFNYMKGH